MLLVPIPGRSHLRAVSQDHSPPGLSPVSSSVRPLKKTGSECSPTLRRCALARVTVAVEAAFHARPASALKPAAFGAQPRRHVAARHRCASPQQPPRGSVALQTTPQRVVPCRGRDTASARRPSYRVAPPSTHSFPHASRQSPALGGIRVLSLHVRRDAPVMPHSASCAELYGSCAAGGTIYGFTGRIEGEKLTAFRVL